jgi:hypothetical protein
MDFITELPITKEGYHAYLVITDRLTKGVKLIPIRSLTAEDTAELFRQRFYKDHGLPYDIISNRGT